MHYAEAGLIQAALNLEAARHRPATDFPHGPSEVAQEAVALEALDRAVETYREAEASLDLGVIPDDTGRHVLSITHFAPLHPDVR